MYGGTSAKIPHAPSKKSFSSENKNISISGDVKDSAVLTMIRRIRGLP
jgi:hypothetical protein